MEMSGGYLAGHMCFVIDNLVFNFHIVKRRKIIVPSLLKNGIYCKRY